MCEHTGITRVIAKERLQLEANLRYFRVYAFKTNDVPDFIYFRGSEGGGVKAVFASVLVAFLATALSFCFMMGGHRVCRVCRVCRVH